jgi:hypothetical protein
MHAKATGFVITGGHHTALVGAAADGHWQQAQGWIVAHLDGRIKTIAIAVNDFALTRWLQLDLLDSNGDVILAVGL